MACSGRCSTSGQIEFDAAAWDSYVAVNRRFAEQVIEINMPRHRLGATSAHAAARCCGNAVPT
jgi:hypothetical protein